MKDKTHTCGTAVYMMRLKRRNWCKTAYLFFCILMLIAFVSGACAQDRVDKMLLDNAERETEHWRRNYLSMSDQCTIIEVILAVVIASCVPTITALGVWVFRTKKKLRFEQNWSLWSKRITSTLATLKKAGPEVLSDIPKNQWPEVVKRYAAEHSADSLIVQGNTILTPEAVQQVATAAPVASVAPVVSSLTRDEQAFYDYILQRGGDYSRGEAAQALGKTPDDILRLEDALRQRGVIE